MLTTIFRTTDLVASGSHAKRSRLEVGSGTDVSGRSSVAPLRRRVPLERPSHSCWRAQLERAHSSRQQPRSTGCPTSVASDVRAKARTQQEGAGVAASAQEGQSLGSCSPFELQEHPQSPRRRLGLIVNPVAGMGGRVGLKGTDGAETLAEARRRGARGIALQRAAQALAQLSLTPDIELLTCSGRMGEDAAEAAGVSSIICFRPSSVETTAGDTRAAAKRLAESGIDLLLFAGGDGTAVDILNAVGQRIPVLGIPAGVKMHSASFAIHPRSAGRLAAAFATHPQSDVFLAEVMDLDEEDLRHGHMTEKLHGYLLVPSSQIAVQGPKVRTLPSERDAADGIASEVLSRVSDDDLLIVGPGTTTGSVLKQLGLEPTLLGVDVVRSRALVLGDASELELMALIDENQQVLILVTPIGGQGFIFGRGNQQLSAELIRRVGRERVIVMATEEKLAGFRGKPLLVDTGDGEFDSRLAGYIRVVTGPRREVVYPLRVAG